MAPTHTRTLHQVGDRVRVYPTQTSTPRATRRRRRSIESAIVMRNREPTEETGERTQEDVRRAEHEREARNVRITDLILPSPLPQMTPEQGREPPEKAEQPTDHEARTRGRISVSSRDNDREESRKKGGRQKSPNPRLSDKASSHWDWRRAGEPRLTRENSLV